MFWKALRDTRSSASDHSIMVQIGCWKRTVDTLSETFYANRMPVVLGQAWGENAQHCMGFSHTHTKTRA